jgi:uncharacterized protein (DUF1501 family)
MRAPSINPRQTRVSRECRQKAGAFFRANPERQYWVRPTMQFEQEGWLGNEHLENPLTLIVRADLTTYRHAAIAFAGELDLVPNEERFLANLWASMQAKAAMSPAGRLSIGPSAHSAMLTISGDSARN